MANSRWQPVLWVCTFVFTIPTLNLPLVLFWFVVFVHLLLFHESSASWSSPLTRSTHSHSLIAPCSMADEYSPPDKATALAYFRHNFARHFDENRAPFNIYIHASWFQSQPHVLEALDEFLTEIQRHEEVFMVSQKQALEWMNTPVALNRVDRLDSWGCGSKKPGPEPCSASNALQCVYDDPVTGNPITLETCAEECPSRFPWLGNTDGSKN